jgi:hypothetical protein
MPAPSKNYYELLGVPRYAKMHDVGRAYNRWVSDANKPDAPPLDLKRATLMKLAYDTLSDPARREAYDRTLVKKATKRAGGAALWGAGIAILVGAGAAAWFWLKPEAPVAPEVDAVSKLLDTTTRAVGRVDSLDMSGKETPIGLAFAIAEGEMVTSCERVPPGAQLRVTLGKRKVPATVKTTDEKYGLCKLAAEGTGAWPLVLADNEPRQGDRVYATKVNSVGQVALVEGTVKRLHGEPAERSIELNLPLAPEWAGGPLLDGYGRVLGAARPMEASVPAQHRRLPRTWVADAFAAQDPKSRAAAAATSAAAQSSPSDAPAQPSDGPKRVPKSLENVPPERVEKLEKAFRPPPSVPDDL